MHTLLVNDWHLLLMYRRHAGTGFTSATSESQIGSELSMDLAQFIRHCHESGKLSYSFDAYITRLDCA